MRAILLALAAPVILFLSGCSKEPGEGGRAEIHGRVVEQRYSNNTQQPVGDPYPLADHRVFIIYGDGDFHDDDIQTGPDGTFKFRWLRKGEYTVYTLSECGDYNGCTFAVYGAASIDGRKDVVDVGTLNVENW